MTLLDKPGALAKIATCLGEAGVSIDQMRQYGHAGERRPGPDRHPQGRPRTTSPTPWRRFAATGVLVGEPVAIRIEEV